MASSDVDMFFFNDEEKKRNEKINDTKVGLNDVLKETMIFFMNNQRLHYIEWLSKTCHEYVQTREVFHLSLSLLDKCLNHPSVNHFLLSITKKQQHVLPEILPLTCLFVCSKYEEDEFIFRIYDYLLTIDTSIYKNHAKIIFELEAILLFEVIHFEFYNITNVWEICHSVVTDEKDEIFYQLIDISCIIFPVYSRTIQEIKKDCLYLRNKYKKQEEEESPSERNIYLDRMLDIFQALLKDFSIPKIQDRVFRYHFSDIFQILYVFLIK